MHPTSRHPPPKDPTKPRIYWIQSDPSTTLHTNRANMNTLFANSTATHISVPACEAHRDYAGNVTRAHTLSHVRALRQIAKDARGCADQAQIAFVAEDTLSCAYARWWTVPLAKVLADAPSDWGVLLLSCVCDEVTRSCVRQWLPQQPGTTAEYAIAHSPQAPYVPWATVRTGSTTMYAVHPRGYRDILKHVRAYKHDRSYPRPSDAASCKSLKSPVFRPDVRAAEMFALTPTYVYHVPLFTEGGDIGQDIGRGREMMLDKRRMDALVEMWYWRMMGWAGRWA